MLGRVRPLKMSGPYVCGLVLFGLNGLRNTISVAAPTTTVPPVRAAPAPAFVLAPGPPVGAAGALGAGGAAQPTVATTSRQASQIRAVIDAPPERPRTRPAP